MNKTKVSNSKSNSKFKLFQSTQESYAFLGINSQQSAQKYPLNRRILTVLLIYSLMCISHAIVLIQALSSVNSFTECANSIFGTATSIFIAMCFAITVFYMPQLFKCIENCEKIIDERKCECKKVSCSSIDYLSETNFRISKC